MYFNYRIFIFGLSKVSFIIQSSRTGKVIAVSENQFYIFLFANTKSLHPTKVFVYLKLRCKLKWNSRQEKVIFFRFLFQIKSLLDKREASWNSLELPESEEPRKWFKVARFANWWTSKVFPKQIFNFSSARCNRNSPKFLPSAIYSWI